MIPLNPPSCVWLDDNGAMAVLTSDGVLYYGRAGLEATTVRVSIQDVYTYRTYSM
jgi:hypothetical protein